MLILETRYVTKFGVVKFDYTETLSMSKILRKYLYSNISIGPYANIIYFLLKYTINEVKLKHRIID